MPGWKDKPTSPWRMSGQLTNRRRQYFVVLGIVVFVMFVLYHPSKVTHSAKFAGGLSREDSTKKTEWENPPTLAKLKKWQENLPQHNLSLPYPEGRTGRYVKFSNQVKRLGWNNAFNEILMNTHLAYESKRAYVFQPYIWKESHYAWPEHKMREIPPSTPLPAIISGPSAGGPWDEGDDAPRSVSEEWFEVVCPKNERTIINTRDVKPNIGWADGVEIFNHWKKILLDSQDRCIEIEPEHYTKDFFPQTFDLWLWGSTRPSHIVKSAVDRNEYLFIPHGPRPKVAVSRSSYDRMLAVHVRRGDFKESCLHLAKYNSTFYSWNLLEDLPDSFTPPPGGEPEKNTPENIEKYLEHCLPSAEDMVRKVRESRYEYLDISKKGHRVLDVLFLLTNEQGEWLEQLKKTFRQDGWHTIVTSKDLELDQEQTEVNMAVDMEIARRAAVFIGNGWSSFTSNIVHKRLVDGKEYFPQSLGVKTPDTVPFIPNPQILATHFMDYDRKSAVSSFYGRKNSMDALNRDFPGPSSSSQRPRDDASSFFNPDAPRSSMDPLNGRPSAGYNRGSYFNAGRAEPVRGGRDEEEAGEKVGEHIWDVYADFNNAGPRYSTNLGQQSSKGYEPLPPSTPLKDDDAASSRNPVEMVTVPALGAEWGREELKDMTKASRKAKKAEARRAQITAFNRGERGLCGKWLTRKTLVFTLFILCAIAAIVLGFTIPRVPSFSFNSEKPLIQASGDWNKTIPTYFNRAPANFSFPAFASLKVDTSSNYLPLKFNSLEAKVYDLDSLRLVGEGELKKLTLPKGFPAIQLPLNITYLGENSSDVTWASWYNACKNKGQYPNGLRPPLKFRLVLDMSIFGLPGKRATSTQISDAPCPIELDQSSA